MSIDNKIKKSGLGAKTSRRLSNAIIYVILVAITLIWLFPFFGLVMESFKVNVTHMDGELFPEKFGFDNYIRLFKETDFMSATRVVPTMKKGLMLRIRLLLIMSSTT